MTSARAKLPRPVLMLVSDANRTGTHQRNRDEWLAGVVAEAVRGGVNIVQLREKHLNTKELVALGQHLRDAIGGRALLFVNGNTDAALELDADGLHLPEDAAPIEHARERVGGRMLISRAAHSLSGARDAERQGADGVLLGTIFATVSKPTAALLGLDGLRDACANLAVPAIAIGGITAQRAPEAITAGAAGVAVISAVLDARDPRSAASALRAALEPAVAARTCA